MAPIRTAVIGYGLSAKIFHIPFILSLPSVYTLHGIVQRNPTESNSAATAFPDAVIYKSTDEMLADNDVDLVIITTIPSTHYALVKQTLDAGKHVLCEKPFVPTAKEAYELESYAQEKGKKLCVYQNRRWDADFVSLRSLLADNTLGRVVECESHFDRHRPAAPKVEAATWKAQESVANGAIYDLGTHLLDQLYTLFGLPEGVTAFVGNQRVYGPGTAGADAGTGDSFTVHLHYPKQGLLATAKAGVVSPEREQLRFWVRGEAGSFRKNNLDSQEDQLKLGLRPTGYVGPTGEVHSLAGKLEASEQYGVEDSQYNGKVTSVKAGTVDAIEERVLAPVSPPKTYVEIYRLLANAIQGGAEVPVPAQQSGDVLRIIEAAIESSQQGKTVKLQ
ncbi:hypothetical protein FH972_024512 [Carpinus fangiana]|uniref:Gfo/Idh/MocA-like oxidoreductase N-terminal domain-containing protein n=1 Tax=Carpinus fangiana TaxID=176857 RepID=A0A5N6KY84_9ROSI|nr:hypothetical protein FH972_024512 [Carpinus fangiana]